MSLPPLGSLLGPFFPYFLCFLHFLSSLLLPFHGLSAPLPFSPCSSLFLSSSLFPTPLSSPLLPSFPPLLLLLPSFSFLSLPPFPSPNLPLFHPPLLSSILFLLSPLLLHSPPSPSSSSRYRSSVWLSWLWIDGVCGKTILERHGRIQASMESIHFQLLVHSQLFNYCFSSEKKQCWLPA